MRIFVSFTYGANVFGNVEVHRPAPVRSAADIADIAEGLWRQSGKKYPQPPVILYWREFPDR